MATAKQQYRNEVPDNVGLHAWWAGLGLVCPMEVAVIRWRWRLEEIPHPCGLAIGLTQRTGYSHNQSQF